MSTVLDHRFPSRESAESVAHSFRRSIREFARPGERDAMVSVERAREFAGGAQFMIVVTLAPSGSPAPL
jgi:hypothetical protein